MKSLVLIGPVVSDEKMFEHRGQDNSNNDNSKADTSASRYQDDC